MDLYAMFVDRLLKDLDKVLGTSHIPTVGYLMLVFTVVFVVTILILQFSSVKVSHRINRDISRTRGFYRVVLGVVIANMSLLLIGVMTSLNNFHYSPILVASLLMIPLVVYLTVLSGSGASRIRVVLLVLATVVIFVFGSRHLVTGIEEGETTSDMINIYVNGYFRWSIHGAHYDLAPLDAILKVMLAYIIGSSIYDSVLASLMYSSYGLAAFLLVYSLVKRSGVNPVPLLLLSMLSYPYSPMIGLSVPPAPLSQLHAISATTIILKPILGYGVFSIGDYISTALFIISASLLHPTALTLSIFLAMLIALLYLRKELPLYRYVLYAFTLAFIIYMIKILYTAFTPGFVGFMQTIWGYIVNAITGGESITSFTTRNLGYSGLPRISLTGFGVLPGFIGGLALPLLLKVLRRRSLSFIEQLFLYTTMLYATFTLASFLTGLGGVSQSRILYNGVQHYMELVLAIYLAIGVLGVERKHKQHIILIPLLLASLATLITPNALPLNYTIPMAKPATLNDHIVAYSFVGLIDRGYYVELYSSCGDLGRLVAMQERGEFFYGLGSTQAGTHYFIAPRVIPAKSYWDPCVMATSSMPRDVEDFIMLKVFDAWVYEFYLYAR